MCLNQRDDISTLNGSSLKLVDEFTNLGSSVSSTQKDIDTRLAKAWTATIGYRSCGRHTWPIKYKAVFFKLRLCRYCYMDTLHGRKRNVWRETMKALPQECCEQYWTYPGGNTSQNSSHTVTYNPSRKLFKLDEPDTRDIPGEEGQTHKRHTPVDPITWTSKGGMPS